MAITVTPLSPALGAEIGGVDLTRPLDAETVQSIRQIWLDHLVIVFRDQKLSEEDQIRFCAALGPVAPTGAPRASPLTQNPDRMLVISNLMENGRYLGTLSVGGLDLHADGLWTPIPPRGTALYALEVPSKGGETCFCNLPAAYEALAPELKAALAGRTARFAYDLGSRYDSAVADETADVRSFDHPAVALHPESGRTLLTVNRMMTVGLSGMADDEAMAVLQRVYDHCEDPRFLYDHEWRVGDLLLWDNRATLHGRRDFDPVERRLLKRVTIQGLAPPQPAVAEAAE